MGSVLFWRQSALTRGMRIFRPLWRSVFGCCQGRAFAEGGCFLAGERGEIFRDFWGLLLQRRRVRRKLEHRKLSGRRANFGLREALPGKFIWSSLFIISSCFLHLFFR